MARPRVIIEDLDSHSISSDFEVADMTDFDEFSVDDMMVMDVIDREIHLGELEEIQELRAAAGQVQDDRSSPDPPVEDADPAAQPEQMDLDGDAARPRPFVPIAGEPQWTVNNFTERNTPEYLRECEFFFLHFYFA